MTPNARLIASLHQAFERRDTHGMSACYAPNATFSDPVFAFRGPEIAAMWTVPCEAAENLRIEARNIAADHSAKRMPSDRMIRAW